MSNLGLPPYYSQQFVDREATDVNDGTDSVSAYYPLMRTPINAGSLSGTLYLESEPIQVFAVSEDGDFKFSDIGSPSKKAVSGTINLNSGEISITWNTPPGVDNHAVVSYDYMQF